MKTRITELILLPLLILLGAMAGCAGKPAVKVSLTPEQTFAAAKIIAQAAASGLDIRIASLKEKPEENSDKIRILTAAKGFLEEFNAQVADVTTLDLSNRDQVRKAMDKALASADNLTKRDVLELDDPSTQAYIRAGIAIARNAVKSFDVFFPAGGAQ